MHAIRSAKHDVYVSKVGGAIIVADRSQQIFRYALLVAERRNSTVDIRLLR